jgi:hypothetical protein
LWLPATEEQRTYHRGDGASSTASNFVACPCSLRPSSSVKLHKHPRLCHLGAIPGCAAIPSPTRTPSLSPPATRRYLNSTQRTALSVVLLRLATPAPASYPGPSPHSFASALAIAAAPNCHSLFDRLLFFVGRRRRRRRQLFRQAKRVRGGSRGCFPGECNGFSGGVNWAVNQSGVPCAICEGRPHRRSWVVGN